MDSTIRDVYANPIGHDIIAKILLQAGLPSFLVENPAASHLKLKWLVKPLSHLLDAEFWPAFLKLVNQEEEGMQEDGQPGDRRWWKSAVFYQIYPSSFCDGNHDGIGDLAGIISKLDYLQDLGVDALWLCPIYDSPMDDNGYDIRDYRAINPRFGTMAQFDALLKEAHQRGMRLIMDLVVNHTSDEHPFFQKALADAHSPYHDYYFFSSSKSVPNNWTSFFSGSAWDQYGDRREWALHLFAKKQVDLNWDNPAVRHDVCTMVNWWLDKGVDGFRLDVINYISKDAGLPDGDVSVGKLMGYTGIEHYYYGPHLHDYLHELHENAFGPHDAFAIGETPGLGMQMAKLVTDERRKELDMIFSFDHLETPGHVRFEDYRYDLNYLRDYLIDWSAHYGSHCWMSLFYNNHDNPRMVSKIDPSGKYRREICLLLAVMQMTLPGTPFVYQGDEMGLANYDFHSIHDLHDIESLRYYKEHVSLGEDPDDVWKRVKAGTRDHARVMLPWNEENPVQKEDPVVCKAYQDLIRLRHSCDALVYGSFHVLDRRHDRFVYLRRDDEETYLIDCSFSAEKQEPYPIHYNWTLVWPSCLYDHKLGPYGARIWKRIDDRKIK